MISQWENMKVLLRPGLVFDQCLLRVPQYPAEALNLQISFSPGTPVLKVYDVPVDENADSTTKSLHVDHLVYFIPRRLRIILMPEKEKRQEVPAP